MPFLVASDFERVVVDLADVVEAFLLVADLVDDVLDEATSVDDEDFVVDFAFFAVVFVVFFAPVLVPVFDVFDFERLDFFFVPVFADRSSRAFSKLAESAVSPSGNEAFVFPCFT